MATQIQDLSTGLRVDNGAARSVLFDSSGNPIVYAGGDRPTNPKGLLTMGLNDSVIRPTRADRFGSLAVATHSPLLSPDFEGTSLNVQQFTTSVTNFTPAQAQGSLSLVSSAVTTTGSFTIISSIRRFKKMQRAPIQAKFRNRSWLVTNSAKEFGFTSAVTGTTQIVQGVYFQVTMSGVLQTVVTFNSTDVTTPLVKPAGGNLLYSDLNTAGYYTYDILMDDDEVRFTIQDTETENMLGEVSLRLPRAQLRLFLDSHPQLFMRVYNGGTAPTQSPIDIYTDIQVTALDANINKTWAQTLSGGGYGATYNPATGVQVTQFTNSTAAGNATLSNTTGSYSTMGGLFSFAAVAGAVTDYALFAITVLAPYQFNLTDINIDTYNDGAAVATSATNLIWGLGLNAVTSNLASGGAFRRLLGNQTFPVGAGVGAVATPVNRTFTSPLVIDSGRTLIVILRLPIGTATGGQIIRGNVDINGFYE